MDKFTAEESESVQFLEPQHLKQWLTQDDLPLIIDVTGENNALTAFAVNAEDAISIPITEFASLINELDPDRPTVVVCQLGQKSFNAAQRLIESDYSCVYSLHGGLEAWKRMLEGSQ